MSQPTRDQVILAFLERLADDRAAGSPGELGDYLPLYPGFEEDVAREFLAARTGDAPAGAPSGKRWVGPYIVEEELGRGGQAVVSVAKDSRRDRRVALKVLVGLGGAGDDVIGRFRREAEIARRLDHPNICPVYETGVHEGAPWIAMRLVDGRTLADIANDDGPDRPDVAGFLEILEKVARALHSAHEAGVVHRDVKPGNIMVTPEGEPVILDFGLASADETGHPTLTRTGDVMGTPAYMSPEQIQAERPGVDRRTDVYSLGVTAYECVTKQRPFRAPTREGVYREILSGRAANPRTLNPEITPSIGRVIEMAMRHASYERYRTAAALADDLAAARHGRAVAAQRVPLARRIRVDAQTGRWVLIVLAIGLMLIVRYARKTPRHQTVREPRNNSLFERLKDAKIKLKLADENSAIELALRSDDLFPDRPEREQAMRDWLQEAEELVGRMPEHRKRLENLESIEARGESLHPRQSLNREALVDVLAALSSLETTTMVAVRRRLETSQRIRATVGRFRERWGAIPVPQWGIIPLGPDSDGRQEFLHLASHVGPLPERSPTGEVPRTAATGIVLVLMPGGSHGPETVAPYFFSKDELTKAQWQRLVEGPAPSPDDALLPAEPPNWTLAKEVLERHGLSLPTTIQWELAVNASTDAARKPGPAPRVSLRAARGIR